MTGATGTDSVGAHWIKAALQVNPFGYNGRGAPSQSFQMKLHTTRRSSSAVWQRVSI